MSLCQPMSALQIEDFLFPPAVKPPSSTNDFFLAGAGVRGLEIPGKFLKVTAIGVYLEEKAVSSLAVKWKGKDAAELNVSVEFFRDIVTGPFEKFTRVTMILPLTGQQYAEKVSENCVAIWKSFGIFTDAEAEAIERFIEAFKHENFSPGSSILFTQLPQGSLSISFAKHDSVPAVANIVIDNKLLSEAVLESIIGKNGVSPAARQSLATRLSEALKESAKSLISSSPVVTKLTVESFSFPASVKPPASNNTLFLSGAGVRGLEINGKFIKFTAIGVFLEDKAVAILADKWKGKSAAELNDSVEFFRDIVTGPFEKFTQVTMILPLTGQQYSEKVAENCVAIWKKLGIYTDAEAKAIEKFLEVFKDETFAPGSSILFTHLSSGSVAISFAKHESVPEDPSCVIDNKLLSESVLESIIGKNGVSPETRTRVASRLFDLFNQC